MSSSGLAVFDKSLQTTHVWLDEIMAEMGPDRIFAWKLLSTILRKLRDRLPVELAAHVGAQLPLMIRGAYYDQFEPSAMPADWHSAEQFLDVVSEGLADSRGVSPADAVAAVFGVLDRHLSDGQVDKICRALPKGIRSLWPALEAEDS